MDRDVGVSVQVAVIPVIFSVNAVTLMVINLCFLSRCKIGPCYFDTGNFFTGIIHDRFFPVFYQPEFPFFYQLYVTEHHACFFIFLSKECINLLAMHTFYFALAFVLTSLPTHRAWCKITIFRRVHPFLVLALVAYSAFPSRFCHTSAFGTGDPHPAAAFFIVQERFLM